MRKSAPNNFSPEPPPGLDLRVPRGRPQSELVREALQRASEGTSGPYDHRHRPAGRLSQPARSLVSMGS